MNNIAICGLHTIYLQLWAEWRNWKKVLRENFNFSIQQDYGNNELTSLYKLRFFSNQNPFQRSPCKILTGAGGVQYSTVRYGTVQWVELDTEWINKTKHSMNISIYHRKKTLLKS